MSWPADMRLCRNCGGVTVSRREWGSGRPLKDLSKCEHCKAPLTQDDAYDGHEIPPAHAEKNHDQ